MLDLSMALWNLCLRGKVAKVLVAFLLISISISFLLIVVGLPAFSRSPRISYSNSEAASHRPLHRAFQAKPLSHATPTPTPSLTLTVAVTPTIAVSASSESPCISAVHRVEEGSSSNSSAKSTSSTTEHSNVHGVTPIPLPVVTITPTLPPTTTPTSTITPTDTPNPTATMTPTPLSTPETTTPTPSSSMTPIPVVTASPTVMPPATPLATGTPVDGVLPVITPTTASNTVTPTVKTYPTATTGPTATSKSTFKHLTFLSSALLVGIPFNLVPLTLHLKQSPGCLNVSLAPPLNPDHASLPFEIVIAFIFGGALLGTTTFYTAIYLVRHRSRINFDRRP